MPQFFVRSHPTVKSKIKEKKRRISLILLLPSAVFAILTCFVYLTYRAACIRKANGGIIVWSVLLAEAEQFALPEATYTMLRILQIYETVEAIHDKPWVENLGITMNSASGCNGFVYMRHRQHKSMFRARASSCREFNCFRNRLSSQL